ncbi:MAG: T9SS type A sorting domain-containing protein [Candidatus Krumholzibacteria bacterium]|nr:T9SS type A sorting domain-containing protein [Candidatus Krumholzibacteria bacterium]MDH4337038.1 T9SS type A sorting domain-containing protein [Candidatus Krumholzibacteria bacterium]MDH5268575.1 T9SS type A sorting domain-containing protein [Candidatus Krumholzibacteria bacterium]
MLARRLILPAVAAACVCAAASVWSAVDITLVGRMNLPNSVFLTNVIIYDDPFSSRLYAILGDDYEKVFIVDVTDPTDMRIAAQIGAIPGFDVRTWDHYLYTCDGNQSGLDSRIIDIADPAHPVVLPNGFPSSHTIQISATGVMYTEFPGLRIFDLADPTAPALLYQTGGEGHDSTPRGNRLYDFHGSNGTVIWDVSDPAAPDTLGVINDPQIRFHHSGDVTADERYLYLCDELITHPGADISIWDIADPAFPVRVGQIADADATVHNIYVVGDLAYVAYYSAGLKVFDLADPTRPVLAGQYDTSRRTGEGFVGAIGCYAYSPDGNIYVCDIENGLFAFSVTDAPAAGVPGAADFSLAQNAPNPFNPATVIPFEVTRGGHVLLEVFDVAGRRVRTLVDDALPAGLHQAGWDGRDGAGREVASGVYFYRMRASGRSETRRMLLLK